jgi:hypothetical protein
LDQFRTNIAIIPKPSAFEKVFGGFVVALMFIPFAIGIFTQNGWLLLSMPIGIFVLVIFSLINKGKFVPKNWVQHESFIEFSLKGVRIISRSQQLDFFWSALENLHLNVAAHEGETRHHGDQTNHYNGTENKITFTVQNLKYDFNFYLKNAEQKESLKLFLQNKDLVAPPAARLTVGEQEETYDAGINHFKNQVPKTEDPKQKRKAIGCMILFFIPFVLIGLGTLGLVAYQFGKVLQAKSWKPANATVRSVDWVSSSGSESTTYAIEIQYEYFFGTKSFTGDAVSFNAGMNNIEHYGPLYDKLNHSKVIQVYVNESDPTESVVVRGVTNAMTGMAIFALMWNALLLTFLLPALSRRIKIKTLVAITLVIWVLGISKLVSHIGDIDISKEVVVVEERQ